ncbi:MAG: carboxypeptidase regulatory-like domain-containing protein [Deltaproteobacteria bacterium]|nr:carboxypeptidase regulatory-like domain-containing protein [Deltaproteobacteria bacterium]
MTRIVGAAAFLLLFVTGCSSSSSDACDPIAQTGCDEGLVCEEVVDGGPACFAPVVLRGNVFDRADDSAIEGATVVALDANSSPASTVGVTDASGDYEMQVARQRDADGNPLGGDVTLRADAAGFQTFPGGIRQALPIDVSSPDEQDGVLVVQTTATDIGLVVQTTATDIGLIALPSGAGTNQIFGNVEVPDDSTGVLVVAETAGDSPLGFTAITRP